MREALELISQGNGWGTAVIGMGAVFASLIILMVFIKVFAATLQSLEKRREAREEALEAKTAPPRELPPSSGEAREVPPEVAAAVAVALSGSGEQEELAAAITYAIHNYISGEAATYAFPTRGVEGEDGAGSSPWSIAGRMSLMNKRSRSVIRGGNL